MHEFARTWTHASSPCDRTFHRPVMSSHNSRAARSSAATSSAFGSGTEVPVVRRAAIFARAHFWCVRLPSEDRRIPMPLARCDRRFEDTHLRRRGGTARRL